MRRALAHPSLNPAQREFARQHDAEVGRPAATGAGVYMYTQSHYRYTRLLIDGFGRVVDSASFQK
jgi:hypothetical protein